MVKYGLKESFMKEYKVIEATTSRQAEELMNQYAQQGWTVISVVSRVYWTNRLVITLEKVR